MKTPLSLIALVALAACSGGGGDAQDNATDPVALVSLGTAQSGAVSETTTIYGAVEKGADAQFTLSAPAEATVTSIAAPAGTAVRRGQLVVGLRPSPSTRAQVGKAQADLRAARAAFARAQRLRADGLASDADVETARQTMQSAQAMAQSLASQTGGLSLRAPGAGYVQSIAANPGDLVSAGTTIATISRVGSLRARFGIDPAVARKLPRSTSLTIRPSGGGAPFGATVQSVDPTVDPQTRLASLYVAIPAGQGLGPGQPLTATVPVQQSGNAITIPYAALMNDGGQPYVYVVQGAVAHRHDVTTGASSGDRIAITKGVAAGDRLVVQGGTGVEDGMKVRTK